MHVEVAGSLSSVLCACMMQLSCSCCAGIQGATAGSCIDNIIQPVVQQRLRVLSNSRQIMGTAHGMLLLHSRGSRSSAIAFHQAVKAARLKLQQQAALINAAEQLNQMQYLPSAQDVADAGGQAASAHGEAITTGTMPVGRTESEGAADGTSGQQTADMGSREAEQVQAQHGHRRTKSASGNTAGQLARQSLQQHSLLYFSIQRQGALLPVPPATAPRAAVAAAEQPANDSLGNTVLQCEMLERGMSAPNPDVAFSGGSRTPASNM